jgi:hypothetical protein
MDDVAERGQRRGGRLATVCAGDAADGATVEVGSGIVVQILEIVERVLHQTG